MRVFLTIFTYVLLCNPRPALPQSIETTRPLDIHVAEEYFTHDYGDLVPSTEHFAAGLQRKPREEAVGIILTMLENRSRARASNLHQATRAAGLYNDPEVKKEIFGILQDEKAPQWLREDAGVAAGDLKDAAVVPILWHVYLTSGNKQNGKDIIEAPALKLIEYSAPLLRKVIEDEKDFMHKHWLLEELVKANDPWAVTEFGKPEYGIAMPGGRDGLRLKAYWVRELRLKRQKEARRGKAPPVEHEDMIGPPADYRAPFEK